MAAILEPIILLLSIVQYTILAAAGLMALALLVRMILQWSDVNPFGRVPAFLRKVTEPVMRPLRRGFDNRTLRFDMLPILAAILLLMYAFFAASIFSGFVFLLADIAQPIAVTPGRVVLWVLLCAINAYLAMLFVRFLLPYFEIGYSSRSNRLLFTLTEPLLKPFRRLLPVGPIDFSPMLLILVLGLAEQFVERLLG